MIRSVSTTLHSVCDGVDNSPISSTCTYFFVPEYTCVSLIDDVVADSGSVSVALVVAWGGK